MKESNFNQLKFQFTGILVFWFLRPNNNLIVKIMNNNKIVEKVCLKGKQKYHLTYFEVKNKSIGLQCFAEKNKYHVANEKGCVTVVKISISITSGVLTTK